MSLSPNITIKSLQQILSDKEQTIQHLHSDVANLGCKHAQLMRQSDDRSSLLIDAYINQITAFVSQLVPIEINNLCFLYWFTDFTPPKDSSYKSAAEALAGLLARKRNQTHECIVHKYETMLRLGFTVHMAMDRMTTDGCVHSIIVAFGKKHGVNTEQLEKIDPLSLTHYARLFNKYEMMLQIGFSVDMALNRMRNDGCDKVVISAFVKKHGMDETEEYDPITYGLNPKEYINIAKGIKMKHLPWKPVRFKRVEGSIWEEIEDERIKYDKKHFELHFQSRPNKSMEEIEQKCCSCASNITCGVRTFPFISTHRREKVKAGLKTLGLSNVQLRTALFSMDEKVMTYDRINQLLSIIPTPEEQMMTEAMMMNNGTRRPTDYGFVEQFFLSLCDIHRLEQRLTLWRFTMRFSELYQHLRDNYKIMCKANDQLRCNRQLRLLLTIVLMFGNHMNSGTRKEHAYGFDISILCTLHEIRSPLNNEVSLLMYIYQFCDEHYPKVLREVERLYDYLKRAKHVNWDEVELTFKTANQLMEQIKDLIRNVSDGIDEYDCEDTFVVIMTRFYKKASVKWKRMRMSFGGASVNIRRSFRIFSFVPTLCMECLECKRSVNEWIGIWLAFFWQLTMVKNKWVALERMKHDNDVNYSSRVYLEMKKQLDFEQRIAKHDRVLRMHLQQKMQFIANGGDIIDSIDNTMKQISDNYKNDITDSQ
eukprot:776939_1